MANAQVQYYHPPPPQAIGATLYLDPEEAQYLYDLLQNVGQLQQQWLADQISVGQAPGSKRRLQGSRETTVVRNRLAQAVASLTDSGLVKHYEDR